MKLICYGASVTAQKFETGYVQQLVDTPSANKFECIEKVAFGASQFEYAGYAFMQDVIDKKPDICVIDWLTPSMKGFNSFKIDLLNRALLDINCYPLWMFFPRVNNFQNLPEAYTQVQSSAEKFGVGFIDVREYMTDFLDNPKKYLRDAVHTTLNGAKLYADIISEALIPIVVQHSKLLTDAKQSLIYSETKAQNLPVPCIKEIETTIDNSKGLEFNFKYLGGFFEVYFDTEIGPEICLLNFQLYRNGEVYYEKTFNNVDPWSYYSRVMVVETLRKRIPEGNYRLVISKKPGNPFFGKETKKPVELICDDQDRHLNIKRISITVDEFEVSITNVGK
tara:strand:+ start:2794 stop:3801 length:1008 start_codon:yes stop_codon:yes gene_type:complete